MPKKSTLAKKQVSNNMLMVVFVLGFAVIGSILIFRSSAAPAKSGTITAPSGDLVFGGTVSFSAEWSKSVKDARLYVECKNDSGALIYGELTSWNTTKRNSTMGAQSITLGGGSSDWHNDPSSSANCIAYLKDYVGAPYTREIIDLAQVAFRASGQ